MQPCQRSVEGSVKHKPEPVSQQDEAWREWKGLVQGLRLSLESKNSDSKLRQLLNDCMALYRDSFSVPPTMDKLLTYIAGRSSSQLEMVFMWVGGWRPSSAITLACSKMGVNVGDDAEQMSTMAPSCLLAESHLFGIKELLRKTCAAESEINNALASVQMLLADQRMAEAFGLDSQANMRRPPEAKLGAGFQVQRLMEKKLAALRTLYMQANALRLRTLQDLQNLLTPNQAAQCVVTAFELAYVMKNLGNPSTCRARAETAGMAKAWCTGKESIPRTTTAAMTDG